MKNFQYAFRYLLKSRGGRLTRIVSLTFGLGVGMLTFSYINFLLTFDRCYPDYQRIYQVWNSYDVEGFRGLSSMQWYPMGEAMAHEMPPVEAATVAKGMFRYNFYVGDEPYDVRFLAVDSSFFDVLDFGVVAGDPKQILTDPGQIMLSESMARRMFGDRDPIGQVVRFKNETDKVVAGIFRDPPVNQHLGRFDAVVSVELIFNSYGHGWEGGDSWPVYVKLKPGARVGDIEPLWDDFYGRHGLDDEIATWNMRHLLIPVTESAMVNSERKQTCYMLAGLALLTLFVACLNYVLVSISTMVNRSKTVGMLRCNGAQKRDIFSIFCWETALLTAVSLVLTGLLIACFSDQIRSVTYYEVAELFAPGRIYVPLAVIVGAFMLAALIPASIFSAIPLHAAFRGVADNRRRWKQSLLFVQIASITLVFSFLTVTSLQYDKLRRGDRGYRPDNLIYYSLMGSRAGFSNIADEVSAMPEVESVGSGYALPIWGGYSGQPCIDENTHELLFSCRIDFIDENFLETMGMELVEGENFTLESPPTDVLVNETYVRMRGWTDSPVGHLITDSPAPDATQYTVVGVVKDWVMTAVTGEIQPIVIHNFNEMMRSENSMYGGSTTVVRLHETTPEAIEAVTEQMKKYRSSDNHRVESVIGQLEGMLVPQRSFRNVVLTVSLITLMIAVVGLVGYLADEIRRRNKEIAIRKVNGARTSDVLRLLARNIVLVALPAVAVGVALGYWVSERWLQQFSARIELRWWIFAASALAVLAVVHLIQTVRTWRTANANPVEMIRRE